MRFTKYLTWPTHRNLETSKKVAESWVAEYEDLRFYQWAIVPKDLNEPIGSISAVKIDDDLELIHIGYCIGHKWWHQGYTSEALSGLVKFFFEEVGANRIESRHDPRNSNSGKVMLKNGLRYEGTMRQADRNKQGICDYSMYGLLAEDYFRRAK
jgi:ribosomal-protein-alanine N-acetyltransferase